MVLLTHPNPCPDVSPRDEGNYTIDYALLVFNLMNSLVVGCIQWISNYLSIEKRTTMRYHLRNVFEMIHIWVRFPRTGILAKMWSLFFKVEPSCDQT